MKFSVARAGLALLFVSLCAASQQTGYSIRTSSLLAVFSGEGVLVRVENTQTGEVMLMANATQFSVQTESGEINDQNCKRVAVRPMPQGLQISYAHPEFEITVIYRAGAEDHYIEKDIHLHHIGQSGFAIKRFSTGRWGPSANEKIVPFFHGQCVTYFLRQQVGGFLCGVRTPFEEVLAGQTESLDLAYPVNMRFEKGTDYDAETAYWGVCRLTGRQAPQSPARIDETTMSLTPPDIGESEAMLSMVRKLAPPRGGMTLVYNGWQGGMYYGDYGEEGGTAEAERDIAVLQAARTMLGPCIVQPAAPFFGGHKQAILLKPTDERLPDSPGRRKLIDWINANELKAMDWACLKAVHGWAKPRLGPYCPGNPEWQADKFANCAANPAYMQWFKRIVLNDLEAGFSGFMSDEPPPGMRYQLFCDKPGHMHLPGDVSYAYFFRRRELFREMRKRFGPDFELQGQRPHMDAGVWDMIYLNSVFTFSEDRGRSADKIREWSRMRRCYSFVPSYMDQIMVQPGFEPVDATMLSALAVSSNFLFIAPSSKEKLEEQGAGVGKDNRRIARGLFDFPEADRARVRFWLDWARTNAKYMDDVIDLPDWPSSGRPDGYLRIRDGAGFAFLFNSTATQQTISIPLDSQVKLNADRSYRLEQVHPVPGSGVISKTAAHWDLPAHSALLISIQPVQ